MAGLHEALLSTLTWPLQKSSDTTGTVHHRRPQLQGVVAVGSGPKLSYETHETQAMSANIRNSRLMAIVATLAPIVFADARAQANSRGTEAALMPRTYEVLVVGYRDPNVTFEKTKQEWEAIRANKLSFLDTVELASIQKLTACGDTIDDDPDKPGAAEAYWRCARPVIENMPDRQGYMQGVVERVEEVLSQSYTKHRYADGAFVYDDDGRKVLDTVRFPPRAYLIYNRIDDVLKPRIACYLHEATKSC